MSPRHYRRARRAAALEQTRHRITRATVDLHGERGIIATTYAEVARRADVSIPTVYKHFPKRSDLILACGAHLAERFPMPGPEIFSEAGGPSSRIRVLVHSLFDFYSRKDPWLARQVTEFGADPQIRRALDRQREALLALVREVLAPAFPGGAPDRLLAAAVALLDYPAWKTLREMSLPSAGHEEAVHEALGTLLRHHRSTTRPGSRGSAHHPSGGDR